MLRLNTPEFEYFNEPEVEKVCPGLKELSKRQLEKTGIESPGDGEKNNRNWSRYSEEILEEHYYPGKNSGKEKSMR